MRPEKIMLVGSGRHREVEKWLAAAGCRVVRVPDGKTAVSRVEREIFDAAVLLSTGDEMDLAETVFNLSDLGSSMEIIIVSDGFTSNERGLDTREIVARSIPNAKILTLEGLKRMFVSE